MPESICLTPMEYTDETNLTSRSARTQKRDNQRLQPGAEKRYSRQTRYRWVSALYTFFTKWLDREQRFLDLHAKGLFP